MPPQPRLHTLTLPWQLCLMRYRAFILLHTEPAPCVYPKQLTHKARCTQVDGDSGDDDVPSGSRDKTRMFAVKDEAVSAAAAVTPGSARSARSSRSRRGSSGRADGVVVGLGGATDRKAIAHSRRMQAMRATPLSKRVAQQVGVAAFAPHMIWPARCSCRARSTNQNRRAPLLQLRVAVRPLASLQCAKALVTLKSPSLARPLPLQVCVASLST